jgi:ABC-2 type transport system ATP-binding protein
VEPGAAGAVLAHLARFGIRDLTSRPPTLEELFMRHYEGPAETPADRPKVDVR